jgi:circadian clock protein KaiC
MAKTPVIQRVATGLSGLDKILLGGLPAGSITLLSGACGTGKSTLAMQFLYNGAKYMNEPGVYVTLEEDPKKLIQNMALFGWDVEGLIAKKKLMIIKPEVYKFESIKQIISDAIDKIGAKRLVVDSYSVLLTYFSDPYEIRNGLVQLDREIKKMNCTAMVISDIKDNSEIFSTTGVEEFIVDGVIVLYLLKMHGHPFDFERAIAVRKMRATHHPLKTYQFNIGGSGIQVGPPQQSGPQAGGLGAGAGLGQIPAPAPQNAPPVVAQPQAVPPEPFPEQQTQEPAPETPEEEGQKKPRKKAKKKKPADSVRLEQKKSSTMIDIKALRSTSGGRAGHSWRWKHL